MDFTILFCMALCRPSRLHDLDWHQKFVQIIDPRIRLVRVNGRCSLQTKLQQKMKKALKWRVGMIVMIVMIVFVAATVSALLIRARPKTLPLVLAFERYSTGLDFYAPHVAFLSLTNTSGKTYYLAMTGNIDTRRLDTPIGLGRYKAGLNESL